MGKQKFARNYTGQRWEKFLWNYCKTSKFLWSIYVTSRLRCHYEEAHYFCSLSFEVFLIPV